MLWQARDKRFELGRRTLVMGILNLTPDSFSDGGRHLAPAAALATAQQMAEEGADIVDIGGESTRPGRPETVSVEEECARVLPLLREVRKRLPSIALSIDTYKAEVARRALEEGADILNDVYALRRAPEITSLLAQEHAGVILMHMQGDPQTMQLAPAYTNVSRDVRDFLGERLAFARSHGIPTECLAVDPGIGFGKTLEHNVRLLAELGELGQLGAPICIGVSRKGFLGKLTGELAVSEREEATLAASCMAVAHGASIVRVHNVRAARRALDVVDAIRLASSF